MVFEKSSLELRYFQISKDKIGAWILSNAEQLISILWLFTAGTRPSRSREVTTGICLRSGCLTSSPRVYENREPRR
jgi:hypothetical protein